MVTRILLAAAVLLATNLPAFADVGSVPLDPGGIEIQGAVTAKGALRLTILMVPTEGAQARVHAVRVSALPSGTTLLTLVAADAPSEVADLAFDGPALAFRSALTAAPLTLQVAAAPEGDRQVRVEYLTQLPTGELRSLIVGEPQFVSLAEFHFSAEPALGTDMLPRECGYCEGVRCGCASCGDLVVCCPQCIAVCPPWNC